MYHEIRMRDKCSHLSSIIHMNDFKIPSFRILTRMSRCYKKNLILTRLVSINKVYTRSERP